MKDNFKVIFGKTPLAWIVKRICKLAENPCMIIDCTKMITIRDTTIFRPENKKNLVRLITELPKILPNQKRTIIVYGIPALLFELPSNEDEKFLNLRIYTFTIKILKEIAKKHEVIIVSFIKNDKPQYLQQTRYYTNNIFKIKGDRDELNLVPFIEHQS